MTRYICVTGGVVSSLGKGIAAASHGAILEARGLVRTYDISQMNNEPVGIDIEMAPNGHFFISNDSDKKVYDITGADRRRPTRVSYFGRLLP